MPFAAFATPRVALPVLVAVLFGTICALLVAAPSAHAQTLSYTAQFAVDDVDPWGGSGVDRASELYEVSWNENGYAADKESLGGAEFGGHIGGATSGRLGIEFGYDASAGTLDIDYPALVDVTYPEDETYFPGDTIRISTVNRSSAGSFDFHPGAQDYTVTGGLALAASASAELCFVSCFGSFDLFPSISAPYTTLDIVDAHANAGQYGDIWDPPLGASSAHVSGDVNLSKPDVSLDVADQGRMMAASSASFSSLELDVDAFSRYPFGKSFSSNGMAMSYDVLDGRIGVNGEENHTFDFRPVVKLTFAFPRQLDYHVVAADGTVGPKQSGDSATIVAGESLDLVLPVDQTQPFAITPTMTLTNTINHTLQHVYQVQGTIKILRASAGIPGFTVIPEICIDFGELGEACTPALEFPGLSFGMGPVYQTAIPITTTRPNLFDRTWAIPFAPHAQDPRGFDPENIPVAHAGGPYDVDEGSSIDLDATASYDLDDDDVLTYAWVLDQAGSLEADGPTPTFDALDGDQTYLATLTVCDLNRNCHSDTATVNVHNVAPTHVLDTSATISFGVGQAFLTRVGVPVTHAATASDVGTDDTTYTWAAGPFATWTPATTTYFNDGVATDPDPSPFGTLPFATSSSSSVTFAQPGIAELVLVVNDDDDGSTSTTVPMLIADTSTTYQSYGWFKQQYSLAGARKLSTTQLDAYLAFTRSGSSWFEERDTLQTSADAYAVLQRLDDRKVTTTDQTRAFVLTAWLNVASGAIDFHAPLPARMVVDGRSTVADALREIERTLLDPAATPKQMLGAMQLAKSIS